MRFKAAAKSISHVSISRAEGSGKSLNESTALEPLIVEFLLVEKSTILTALSLKPVSRSKSNEIRFPRYIVTELPYDQPNATFSTPADFYSPDWRNKHVRSTTTRARSIRARHARVVRPLVSNTRRYVRHLRAPRRRFSRSHESRRDEPGDVSIRHRRFLPRLVICVHVRDASVGFVERGNACDRPNCRSNRHLTRSEPPSERPLGRWDGRGRR